MSGLKRVVLLMLFMCFCSQGYLHAQTYRLPSASTFSIAYAGFKQTTHLFPRFVGLSLPRLSVEARALIVAFFESIASCASEKRGDR